LAASSQAQINLGPVTVGAGLQTSYTNTDTSGPGGTDTNQFALDHMRLYVSGPVTDTIKFMFNTDYDSVTNKIGVLDAVAQFEFSPEVNFWVGRFLPPSDRANLYGPFYSHEWAVYTDGVQDGYPAVFQGRDNGVAYWGTFAKKVKISAGVFDGGSATGNSRIVGAARVQIDFWDPEDGYYLNGTYYGDRICSPLAAPRRSKMAALALPSIFCSKGNCVMPASSQSRVSIPITTVWADTSQPTVTAKARTGWEATYFRR